MSSVTVHTGRAQSKKWNDKGQRTHFCHHCGNDAAALVSGFIMDNMVSPHTTCEFYFCLTCKEASLRRLDKLVYPVVKQLPTGIVPERVRQIYQEAVSIKSKAPSAFANQIRRALEAVCKDKGYTSGDLFKKLKNMTNDSVIPEQLSNMTTLIRKIGNVGSHDNDIDVEPDWVDPIDEFFLAVVEYVYIAPNKIEQLTEKFDAVSD